ncbi:hypothetical protein [Streptomyces sp. NPDC088739]|uniref:hypothetical protein n=1 Tax=Streptomyces sp. NPDC088739 TaxID=3365882 RepID=UPI0038062AC2
MATHFISVVLPPELTGASVASSLLVLAGETAQDIASLPLPVALHTQGNELYGYGPHAQPFFGPLPVSDIWLWATAPVGPYKAQTRVAVILEPVPADIATTYVPVELGVEGGDLPPWLMDALHGRYEMAVREMLVSSGSILMLDTALGAPTKLPEWANL